MTNPRTIARIEARIHERAAHALEHEINDPRTGFITITRVELSPDLLHGKIFYSVLGGRSERSKAQHMLDSAAGFLQRKIVSVLQMRKSPRLTWHFDESLIVAQRVDDSIKRALERDKLIQEQGRAPEIEPPADWEEEYEESAGDLGARPRKTPPSAPPPPVE
jgi:ribosome-binding factor A